MEKNPLEQNPYAETAQSQAAYEKLQAAGKEAVKNEPLLSSGNGDSISAQHNDEPTAENNKQTVDAAIERVSAKLESSGYKLVLTYNEGGMRYWRVSEK